MLGWFYAPKVGGTESIMRFISEGLVRRGYDVTVVSSDATFSKDKINGVKIVRTPLLHPKEDNYAELRRWFKKFIKDFDIVHCHNLSYPYNVKKSMIILKCCNELGIPIIEHAHNAQLRTPMKTRKIIKGNFYKIICVSNYVKNRLQKLGVEKEKLEVVHNAIDLKLFNPSVSGKQILEQINPGSPKIFFPGRVVRISKLEIGKQKQFKTLVNALRLLKSDGLDFILIIPGPEGQPNATKEDVKNARIVINHYLEKMGLLENTFIFDRLISIEDMPKIYAAIDIVCMPSLNETFGMVFAEAQSMKKPVIATKTGAAPEIVKGGIIVEPKDPQRLSHAIKKLLQNERLREKLGKIGHDYVVNKFNIKTLILKVEKIYHLLDKKELLLVRHPEATHNVEGKFGGWTETILTKKGKEQAKRIVLYFKNKKLDVVYTSDLKRCRQLAMKIAKNANCPLIVDANLRERYYGSAESKRTIKIPKDSEPLTELNKRIRKFIKRIKLPRVAIVTHSGPMETIIKILSGEKLISKNAQIIKINT